MIVTVFRSRLQPGVRDEYVALVDRMNELARTMPGYISHKGFTADDGERPRLPRVFIRDAARLAHRDPGALEQRRRQARPGTRRPRARAHGDQGTGIRDGDADAPPGGGGQSGRAHIGRRSGVGEPDRALCVCGGAAQDRARTFPTQTAPVRRANRRLIFGATGRGAQTRHPPDCCVVPVSYLTINRRGRIDPVKFGA